ARTPREPSQRGCATRVGFDLMASNFEDELMELAQRDSVSTSTQHPLVSAAQSQKSAATATQGATTHAPPARQHSLPNIIVTGAHILRVSQISPGVWNESYPMQDGFVVQFTNEARTNGTNVGGLVKAQLVFHDGVRELRRITGGWLNQSSDMTEFRVD